MLNDMGSILGMYMSIWVSEGLGKDPSVEAQANSTMCYGDISIVPGQRLC